MATLQSTKYGAVCIVSCIVMLNLSVPITQCHSTRDLTRFSPGASSTYYRKMEPRWRSAYVNTVPVRRNSSGRRFLHLVQKNKNFPQHIAHRIVDRVMQFHNNFVLHHICSYGRVISMDMKWLIFEIPENYVRERCVIHFQSIPSYSC